MTKEELIFMWQQRQATYEKFAEKHRGVDQRVYERYIYKAQATRDCWKELIESNENTETHPTLDDKFHEWIESNDWRFDPVVKDKKVIYRWTNEAYSGQVTTKELYEIYLSQI